MFNRREFLKLSSIAIITSSTSLSAREQIQPDEFFDEDVFVKLKYKESFSSVREKLTLIQKYIGYGNFNIVGFDDALKIAKGASNIGAFSKDELEFLESIFYYDPSSHGFFGERVTKNITDNISKKDVIKIPATGHYLFKGKPEDTYNEMVKDVGNTIILTSGVRSVIKQTKLFLDKVNSINGNITVAAKSIAPPAYTYHSISDFDVGKKGFGYANFTSRFALTDEFRRIKKLKYVDVRYTVNNKDGVRYEPWHIKTI